MRNNYYLVFMVLFLFIGGGCLAATKQQVTSVPLREQESAATDYPRVYNFGQVEDGTIVSHNFVVKNESMVILNITDVKTSCGCTVADIQKKALAAGESTLVEVKFDSKGFIGTVQKEISVSTDDPVNQIIKFTINGEVKPIKNDPYFWDFGQVKEGDITKHNFIFKNETPNVLNIRSVNVSCGCITAKAAKLALSPGEITEVEVNFNSTGYSGEVFQYVFIDTDRADKPMSRLVVKANVVK